MQAKRTKRNSYVGNAQALNGISEAKSRNDGNAGTWTLTCASDGAWRWWNGDQLKFVDWVGRWSYPHLTLASSRSAWLP